MSPTDPTGNSASDRSQHILAFATAAFTLFGICFWVSYPSGFISDDSFFYPVIARNWVLTGHHTFSGIVDTNGVHPLWLWLLEGYSRIAHAIDPALLYKTGYAVPLSAAFLIWGAINCWAIAKCVGWSPPLFTIIPVAYNIIFGVLYSEAHVHFATLTGLIRILVAPPRRSGWHVPMLAAAIAASFLARLDSAFTIAALLFWSSIHWHNFRLTVYSGCLAALPVAVYLLGNQISLGRMMPVSGWMKSTWPEITWKGIDSSGMSMSLGGYSIISGLMPLLFATWVLWRSRARMTSIQRFLIASWVGVIFHCLYIALFTRGFTQWYWYYVQSILLGAGAACSYAYVNRLRESLCRAFALVLMVGACIALASGRRTPSMPESHIASKAVAYLHNNNINDATIIVSDFPGYLAFMSPNRIFALDLLTANCRFYEDMRMSPNSLAYILDHCAMMGCPVSHVLFLGGPWLTMSKAKERIDFMDPRRPEHSIGFLNPELGLGAPLQFANLIVWPVVNHR